MKKIWVNKAKSFKEAEEFDRKYYTSMTGEERLETMQFLREIYLKFFLKIKKGSKDESRKGLRRTIKILQ